MSAFAGFVRSALKIKRPDAFRSPVVPAGIFREFDGSGKFRKVGLEGDAFAFVELEFDGRLDCAEYWQKQHKRCGENGVQIHDITSGLVGSNGLRPDFFRTSPAEIPVDVGSAGISP
ncbi:hypothetical protein SDC9_115987 [bioreactor metagenome]|uniref:Uncharacterized protein n=1 Tax=bioreactor metagenome TaxID=1076179 RepID=A0A645C126_9ZZZZ